MQQTDPILGRNYLSGLCYHYCVYLDAAAKKIHSSLEVYKNCPGLTQIKTWLNERLWFP